MYLQRRAANTGMSRLGYNIYSEYRDVMRKKCGIDVRMRDALT